MPDKIELKDNDLEQINGGYYQNGDGTYTFLSGEGYRDHNPLDLCDYIYDVMHNITVGRNDTVPCHVTKTDENGNVTHFDANVTASLLMDYEKLGGQ